MDQQMPSVLRSGPYRFYFFSHEPNEPPHVHIDRDEATAKVWLDSLDQCHIGDRRTAPERFVGGVA